MSVGTWGPGTGATGTGAHPFCLRIQGVCVIGSTVMESIVVSQSVSGNATLTFTLYDPDGTLAVPDGWADVEFADRTEAEWLFGGLVMGTTVRLGAASARWIDVRCVDYGVVLDTAPVLSTVDADAGQGAGDYGPHSTFQAIAAAAPLGGITALRWVAGGHGCLVSSKDGVDYTLFFANATETVGSPGVARSGLETYADRVEIIAITDPFYTLAPADVYVTPLRQLAALPAGATFSAAPLEVRQNPTTSAHVAAEVISLESDARVIESGIYISDSDTSLGGDNSGFALGTVNGYTVAPSTRSFPATVAAPGAWFTDEYLRAKRNPNRAARAVVTSAKNFQIGQALTVYYPGLGLDGTYAIAAVTTRFLGGTNYLRRSDIQFAASTTSQSGEVGTVSRFNRTRFARAGVRT